MSECVTCELNARGDELPPQEHVHFHVVPRMAWFEPDHIGPHALRFLNVSDEERVPAEEQQRISVRIGEAIRAALS